MKLVADLSFGARPLRPRAGWSPRALFAGGFDGVWYDPSAAGTLFSDSNGTVPAAVGSAVARIEDLSGNGHHAVQPAAAARPVLGVEPTTGRRNLVVHSDDLGRSAWLKIQNGIVVGTNRLQSGGTNHSPRALQRTGVPLSAGRPVTISATVTPAEVSMFRLRLRTHTETGIAGVPSIEPTIAIGEAPPQGATVTDLGDGRYRISMTYTPAEDTATSSVAIALTVPGGATVPAGHGALIERVQFEFAGAATAYQRVVTEHEVSEDGVGSRHFLAFDGIGDVLETPLAGLGLDTTQAAVWCGFMAAGAGGSILDASGGDAGDPAFGLCPVGGDRVELRVGGGDGAGGAAALSPLAPRRVAAAWDRAGGTGEVVWNGGVVEAIAPGALSRDAPLRIGQRVGGGYFRGRLYGLIVRKTATDLATLHAADRIMRGKAAATP